MVNETARTMSLFLLLSLTFSLLRLHERDLMSDRWGSERAWLIDAMRKEIPRYCFPGERQYQMLQNHNLWSLPLTQDAVLVKVLNICCTTKHYNTIFQ